MCVWSSNLNSFRHLSIPQIKTSENVITTKQHIYRFSLGQCGYILHMMKWKPLSWKPLSNYHDEYITAKPMISRFPKRRQEAGRLLNVQLPWLLWTKLIKINLKINALLAPKYASDERIESIFCVRRKPANFYHHGGEFKYLIVVWLSRIFSFTLVYRVFQNNC